MNRLLPYFQLIRLPNVFTAWADIILAALVTGALPGQALPFVCLLLSSSCLYFSGMVWNDYFDVKQDERQRPFRPLPAGKISMTTAAWLASGLMVLGMAFAIAAGVREDGFHGHSMMMAILLAGAILLYDSSLKQGWAGPLGMGACRFLNVVLGLTVVAWAQWTYWGLLLALVVGIYIVGLTWFAQTEAEESNRTQLWGAAGVMLLAVFVALIIPAVGPVPRDPDSYLPTNRLVMVGQLLYPYMLVGFAVFLGIPVYKAIQHPVPERVQVAVKTLLFGLVLLDAILATVFVGPFGLLLLLLLVPAHYVGQWVYST